MLGTLYGVGAGPGAPDLLTLRAVEIVRSVQVLALPRSSPYGASTAWNIVRSVAMDVPLQERLFLTFPMNKDADALTAAWAEAAATIEERLERGLSVAFVTEGDPSLYSTFIYLRDEIARRWPEVRIEVVPGVSSIAAVPAVIGVALADGRERIAILPGNYGLSDLDYVLDEFDTVIVMKIGGEMETIVSVLERKGMLDRATYVAKATTPAQRIVRDLKDVRGERCDCFAMVVIARKERNGVLGAQTAAAHD